MDRIVAHEIEIRYKGENFKMKSLSFGKIALVFYLLSSFASPASAEGRVLGMIIKEPTAPYIQAFIRAAEDQAKESGVTLLIRDGEANSLKILETIDTFIAQKIDGFIMAGAVDLRGLVPGIRRLNEEKIPIAALDTSPEGGKVDLFLSFDIEKASAKAARAFIEGIKARNNGQVPEGVVVEITGDLTDMFSHECNKGFSSVMAGYPQLTVAQGEGKWNNVDSHQKTSDLLTRYGDSVKGIYVHTPDLMAPGVVSAIESAGLEAKDFGIAGICIGPEGLDLIKKGKVLAIVEQPAYDAARLAIRGLLDLLDGKPAPKTGTAIVEEGAIWSPADVVANPWTDEGVFIVLQAPLVPSEVAPDDPRLWENRLSK